MVFDFPIQKRFLEKKLKKIRATAIKQNMEAKKKLAKIQKIQDKKNNIFKAKLKAENELSEIKKKIKDAKKLKLTPTEKKILLAKQTTRKKKIDKINKNLKSIRNIMKLASLDALKIIDTGLKDSRKRKKKRAK